jgi:hypothetical protein
MDNIQHDYFIWEENSYTEQKKNDKNNNESVHCVTTTTTKNDLTQKDWKDITNPKERRKTYHKVYYEVNKQTLNDKHKAYNKVNKDKIIRRSKAYYETNKDKVKAYQKDYKESNKDKLRFQKKAHYEINKDKIRVQKNNYYNNKRKTDIQFKLSRNLRSRLNSAVNGNYKSGSEIKDLGCTIEQLKQYLESKFQSGMSWDNWTLDGWHIDHIKPLASFDLTDRKQLLEACHYTNLQPLWATDNLIKSDKLV